MIMKKISNSLAEQILKKLNKNYKLQRLEKIIDGRVNDVYKATVEDQVEKNYILKIRDFEDKNLKQGFAIEKIINEKLSGIGINNLPKIYYSDKSKLYFPFDYSILEFINGETLDKLKNDEALFFNSGKVLAKIHSLKVNYLGKVYEDKVPSDKSNLHYINYFKKVINELSVYDYLLAMKVKKFVEENFCIDYYNGIKPVLLHNDFHMKNIIVTPDKDIKLIDWDCAKYAHSEIDFIKFRHLKKSNNDISNFDSLIKGYKSIKELEITPNFFVHEIIWFARMYTFEKVNCMNISDYFPKVTYYNDKILQYCSKKSSNILYEEWNNELQRNYRKYRC